MCKLKAFSGGLSSLIPLSCFFVYFGLHCSVFVPLMIFEIQSTWALTLFHLRSMMSESGPQGLGIPSYLSVQSHPPPDTVPTTIILPFLSYINGPPNNSHLRNTNGWTWILETWHLRHWLQFWQLRTWIQSIIFTWHLIVTLDSIRNFCDVWECIWFITQNFLSFLQNNWSPIFFSSGSHFLFKLHVFPFGLYS